MAFQTYGPFTVHIPTALDKYAQSFVDPDAVYPFIIPPLPVEKQFDKFFKFGRERFLIRKTVTAATGENNLYTESIDNDSFSCKEFGLESILRWNTIQNEDGAVKSRMRITKGIVSSLQRDLDDKTHTFVTTSGNYNNSIDAHAAAYGTTYWTAATGGSMVASIQDAQTKLRQTWGTNGNLLIIPPRQWFGAVNANADIKGFFYLTAPTPTLTLLNTEQVAKFFGIETVLVPQCIAATSAEGVEPVVTNWIYNSDTSAELLWVDKASSVEDASWAKTFMWTQQGKGTFSTTVTSEPRFARDIINVNVAYDIKLTAKDAGCIITNISSS